MLKVLSQNKINSILAECQTPDAVKVLSDTKNASTSMFIDTINTAFDFSMNDSW